MHSLSYFRRLTAPRGCSTVPCGQPRCQATPPSSSTSCGRAGSTSPLRCVLSRCHPGGAPHQARDFNSRDFNSRDFNSRDFNSKDFNSYRAEPPGRDVADVGGPEAVPVQMVCRLPRARQLQPDGLGGWSLAEEGPTLDPRSGGFVRIRKSASRI